MMTLTQNRTIEQILADPDLDGVYKLEAIEETLTSIEELQKELQAKADKMWDEAYKLFNRIDGQNQPARHLFQNGMILGRIIQHRIKVNEAVAQQILKKTVYNSVTEVKRVLNAELLQKAVIKGKVTEEEVKQIITPNPIPAKRHSKATKDELAEIEAMKALV